ncbi:hypothetical protein MMPV_009580 [Pyropia vietnamensis]
MADEPLGTEESISRGSAMETTRSIVDPPAGTDNSTRPMAETPAEEVRAGAEVGTGGLGEVTPDPHGEEGGGAVPPLPPRRYLLPPIPRAPAAPRLWVQPSTVEELPSGILKRVMLEVPAERRADVMARRARRFPAQVRLPEGVSCDLPALLKLEDGTEVAALAQLLAAGSGDAEVDESYPSVRADWCVLPRPYLGGQDAHIHHAWVREEHRIRVSSGYLVHGARGEFAQVSQDKKTDHFPSVPGWWSEVEVPVGFPARVPLVVAYFGSYLMGPVEGHRAYATLATHWVVEVARAWYSDVIHRGYLWHLSTTLMEGIATLGVEWFTQGLGDQVSTTLVAMTALHNQLDWENIKPYLRRSKRSEPGAEMDPPRDFVHCTRGAVQGNLLLCEGLGDPELPYAEGVYRTTPAPPSGWAVSGRAAATRRESRRVVPRGRGQESSPGRGRASSPTARQAGSSQPPAYEFIEPFPESGLAELRGWTSVPQPLARGTGEMLPNLGATLYDTSMEAALLASLDTMARMTRRVSNFFTQSGNDAESRRTLAAEVTRLAVGHEFVQRLLHHGRRLHRDGGSSHSPGWYSRGGPGSRVGYPWSYPPTPSGPGSWTPGHTHPRPGYDQAYASSAGPSQGPGDRMNS